MRIIAGTAGGRRIDAPAGRDTRPTLDRVRENLFNMLQTRVYGARVLDLFAGSGALSLEALSRGSESAVLADHDREANRIQKKNIETLGFGNRTRVFLCDWRKAAETLVAEGHQFDLIFLDPPYAMTDLTDVMTAVCGLMHDDTLVVLEHEARAELTVPDELELVNARNWGFCGVSFYMRKDGDIRA